MLTRRPFLAGAVAGAGAAAAGLALPLFARASTAEPASVVTAEPFAVVLDWLLDANHAALFAAIHSGAFARAGLDVTLVAPSDPDLPCRMVAAGQADLAISYGTQIDMITEAGLPLLRIATLIDRPLNTVMALADGPVRTLADLKGRSVGVSVGGVEEALLGAMLQSVGLAIGDVSTVKVNYGMVPALLSHRLDAAIGAFRNDEVLEVGELARPPRVFLPEAHGVPAYDELILVARRDRAGDPRLVRFVRALREGTRVLLADPAAMRRAFVLAHPEQDTVLGRASWDATMPAVAVDPARLDRARYLAFQAFAVSHGIVAHAQPLDQVAVQLLG